MKLLTSGKSWLTAPVVAVAWFALLLILWGVVDPQRFVLWFSVGDGFAPVEWMTLPLFGLVIPLVWLCPPQAGPTRRQCAWASLWSLLGIIAIIRETDLHKLAFAQLWPEVAATFKGTVFKLRFLKADGIPLMPKLFVVIFFIVFFAVAVIPLVRYFLPLVRGFFRFEPVAWSTAAFGAVSVFVLMIDRLPAKLRDWGIVDLREVGHEATLALCKGLEEGSEMLMAMLALLAILQSHLLFGRDSEERG